VRRINQFKEEGNNEMFGEKEWYSNLTDGTSPFFLFSRMYVLILPIYDIINIHSYMQGGRWLLP
jgi:hypothetical protein